MFFFQRIRCCFLRFYILIMKSGGFYVCGIGRACITVLSVTKHEYDAVKLNENSLCFINSLRSVHFFLLVADISVTKHENSTKTIMLIGSDENYALLKFQVVP